MLTNEEARLHIYSHGNTPTDPSSVTSEMPLSDLNLNWTEKNLPQKLRTRHVHGLHPYLGKFIPQLVEVFLRKYFLPSSTVLDPFVGSGTTLVQANELGINSVGYDISAFNILLCKVKTTKYDIDLARQEANDALEKARDLTQDSKSFTVVSTLTTDQYLLDWYAPQSLFELLTYKDIIETGDYYYKDLLKIILTRSARSARLTTHFDLDFPKRPQRDPYWCYKHSRTCRPTPIPSPIRQLWPVGADYGRCLIER